MALMRVHDETIIDDDVNIMTIKVTITTINVVQGWSYMFAEFVFLIKRQL